MKTRLLTFVFALSLGTAIAQDETDAIRYGYTPYFGTARSIGLGNAMGSLGADFASLSINPAGIGVYRRGEVSFSPTFNNSNWQNTYMGNTTQEAVSQFNLSHIGMVLTSSKPQRNDKYKNRGWISKSFAFGMNRLQNYKNEYSISGNNYKSSLIERYAEELNSKGGIQYLSIASSPAFAAYQTWLIDRGYGADSNKAVSYVPYWDGLKQTKRIIESGNMQEIVISAGGNYQDKLMLGVTLGIPRVTFDQTIMFDEEDISGKTNNDFKYMYFTQKLKTTGTGVNLKMGAIIKASPYFRFGMAFHTPSYIQFNDVSSIEMQSHTDSLLTQMTPPKSPISQYTQDTALAFNYTQTTPYRALASGTVLFDRHGFITADIEYVDYSSMRYDFGTGFENESRSVNTSIRNTYKSNVNIRLGAEAKINDFSIRAGVAYYGSPYKNSQSDASMLVLSGGGGYRAKNWFLDATLMHRNQKQTQLPYVLQRQDADVQRASMQNSVMSMILTLGFRM